MPTSCETDGAMQFPFGPPIQILQAPESVTACIDAYYEEAASQARLDQLDHSAMLVGEADRQIRFDEAGAPELLRDDVRAAQSYFQQATLTYARAAQQRRMGHRASAAGEPAPSLHIEEWSAWIVNQLQGDYNPVHSHLRFDVTGVAYTRVPSSLSLPPRSGGKASPDGTLEFVFGVDHAYAPARYRVYPRRGMVILFPSFLFHVVYPFRGSDEARRSFSFNAIFGAA